MTKRMDQVISEHGYQFVAEGGRPFLRTPYNYDMNRAGDESGLKCLDETLTKQSFADEVDINTIVRRFNLTGELPTNQRMPTYADFDGVHDFHTAMNAIAQANEAFDAMPADVRARFHNDPAEFIAFCDDGKNLDEARKLGLVPAQEVTKAAALASSTPPSQKGEEAPKPQKTPPKGGEGG